MQSVKKPAVNTNFNNNWQNKKKVSLRKKSQAHKQLEIKMIF
jgi:hypothetical protein